MASGGQGWVTTKIHAGVEGHGRPLAIVITDGQRNDGAMLPEVLADIHVPRLGAGRPRTRPDAVLANRAHAPGVIRNELHRCGIKLVIPEKIDQITARARQGSRGGRPQAWTPRPTKAATSSNAAWSLTRFALTKQWRGPATRYDKLVIRSIHRAAVHRSLAPEEHRRLDRHDRRRLRQLRHAID